ncbi:hypothetical protein DXG01_003768 [Tephrocybe rancida]|nr:hypothetical protein DXG01_003768 [Tephrocybe rancida]
MIKSQSTLRDSLNTKRAATDISEDESRSSKRLCSNPKEPETPTPRSKHSSSGSKKFGPSEGVGSPSPGRLAHSASPEKLHSSSPSFCPDSEEARENALYSDSGRCGDAQGNEWEVLGIAREELYPPSKVSGDPDAEWTSWMTEAQVRSAYQDIQAEYGVLELLMRQTEAKANSLEAQNQALKYELRQAHKNLREAKLLMVAAGQKLAGAGGRDMPSDEVVISV